MPPLPAVRIGSVRRHRLICGVTTLSANAICWASCGNPKQSSAFSPAIWRFCRAPDGRNSQHPRRNHTGLAPAGPSGRAQVRRRTERTAPIRPGTYTSTDCAPAPPCQTFEAHIQIPVGGIEALYVRSFNGGPRGTAGKAAIMTTAHTLRGGPGAREMIRHTEQDSTAIQLRLNELSRATSG
jgi:hypothetical protein